MEGMEFPVSLLDQIPRACDPGEPLEPGDTRYADLKALRQGVGLKRLKQELNSSPASGRFHHRCVCGHRGTGKSTELLAFKEWADAQGYLTVRTEVDERFGLISLEVADLFLLTATVAEQAMREFGAPLPDDKILRVIQWFAEITKEDRDEAKSEISVEVGAQLKSEIPLLGKLFAKLTAGGKAASSHATTVRQRIRNFPDTLADFTNDLLDWASAKLVEQDKPRGLLLLFDNLDRYDPENIDRLLYRSSDLVHRLACHAVFTIPISLEYDPPSGVIQDCYGFSVVLPMLSLRRRTDAWGAMVADTAFDAGGVRIVREALGKRVAVETLFANPTDADRLIKMSGGCIRDLMHLVTLAHAHSEEGAAQLTQPAVQSAIREMRATYIRRLDADDYDALAKIARRDPGVTEEKKRRLLYHRFALEYLDENAVPWVDIHPLVLETEEFRHAYHRQSPLAG